MFEYSNAQKRGAMVTACFLQNEPTSLHTLQSKSFWDEGIGKPSVKTRLVVCIIPEAKRACHGQGEV